MKTIFSLLLIFLGLDHPKEFGFETCAQDDQYNCAANMLSMNYKLCMDFSEVSGRMYKAFLLDQKNQYGANSEEFQSNLPDWVLWEQVYSGLKADKIEQLFFETTTFALAPVVAVTYEQAEYFVKWRTEAFKKDLAKMNKRDRALFPEEFEFRLPTAAEWSRIRFMTQEKGMLKAVAQKSAEFNDEFDLKKNKILLKGAKISPVFSGMDEKLGMFQLHGNVSEITARKGTAVGGNWTLSNNEVDFYKEITYEAAQAWLGFRCVFEIIE
ncbi:MAG: sulfatase activating formylglycine-generating enzyme [Roseivirga sp.]|jgi:formylglycine-generating enzyme required for sulfatase activity